MLVAVLASGSEGNITYIDTGSKKILIDLGMNYTYLKNELEKYGTTPAEIDCVFITHTHSDHTGAMKVFLKKNKPFIYLDPKMMTELPFLEDYPNLVFDDGAVELEDVVVEIFKTSHDAPGSRGYIFKKGDKSVVYITDTGYINSRNFEKLKNHTLYIFESNHDIEMLMHGKYPDWLKRRISSDLGHLSNNQASFYLSKLIGDNTKKVILAHLSKDNNRPEIALKTVKDGLKENGIDFDKFMIAKQRESVDVKL